MTDLDKKHNDSELNVLKDWEEVTYNELVWLHAETETHHFTISYDTETKYTLLYVLEKNCESFHRNDPVLSKKCNDIEDAKVRAELFILNLKR